MTTHFYWASNTDWLRKVLEKRLARAGIVARNWRTEMQLGRPGVAFDVDEPVPFDVIHRDDPEDLN